MDIQLKQFVNIDGGAIFGCWVADPSAYGLVEFSADSPALSLEEKPSPPKSHYAVPGLYPYDNDVMEYAINLKRSARGELEITDVNRTYLKQRRLSVEVLTPGTGWLDKGTFNSLNDASNYIRTIEARQGLKIQAPEEIAWRNGSIDDDELRRLAEPLESGNGACLLELLNAGDTRRREAETC